VSYLIRFAPESAGQLENLYSSAGRRRRQTPRGFVDSLMDHYEGLAAFPHRGTAREDLRPGLLTMSYKKRVVTAFTADDSREQVTVLGVFNGGQDFESVLNDPDE